MITPECAICARLQECKEVTEKKIIDRYHCRLWRVASTGALKARQDIIQDLGLWALRYEVRNLQRSSARPKARRRKRNV